MKDGLSAHRASLHVSMHNCDLSSSEKGGGNHMLAVLKMDRRE